RHKSCPSHTRRCLGGDLQRGARIGSRSHGSTVAPDRWRQAPVGRRCTRYRQPMTRRFRPKRAIKAIDPVTDFLKTEEGGGLALFAGSVIALLWVNVLGVSGYQSF